jgi:DNA helicase-2/ATP-dependent DNA helicase PcrA
LGQLSLHPPDASGERAGEPHLDDDWLVLSTIHSAKGLEWECVTVLQASDGMIPSDLATGRPEEIEEERRLFYVGLTRAKRHLTVVYPQRYHPKERRRADRHLFAKVTRFLPDATLDLFETVVREGPRLRGRGASSGPGAVTNLRARARSRWDL